MSVSKTKIEIISPEPLLLFVQTHPRLATIVSLDSIVDGGIPLKTDENGDCNDEQMTFVGIVDHSLPEGDVDLDTFELPVEAIEMMEAE